MDKYTPIVTACKQIYNDSDGIWKNIRQCTPIMEAYGQIGESKLAREDARRALSLNRRNRVASDILVKYPEKIELTGGVSRYRPKGDINKYRVWASSQGFAFSKKTEEKDTSQESQENK